ncbi:MAG: CDP-glucose 4,6-dehydratase, partial [Actinobacteria bacterium]|nr:CDP-glucose 4,6-dehydratase [Actinomycetota bacterium]
PSLHEAAAVRELVRGEEGDVANLENLVEALARYRPEVVFHLAAQSLVRQSYEDPVATFRTNVLGTANVLEAVRRVGGVRVVINVTSDKCYLNNDWDWGYRESDELGGSDPYSSSKACAELVSAAYGRAFFSGERDGETRTTLASARAGNVIGGGDFSVDRLVPDAIRAAWAGEPLVVRNPYAVRPWQHVLDCLDGYLLLAERLWHDPGLAGPWNFGPDEQSTRSVLWLVERLTTLFASSGPGWRHQPSDDGRHEARSLRLDSSRARCRLGWKPKLSIEDAVQLAARWYEAFRRDGDGRRTTIEQLDAYAGRSAELKP